MKKEQIKIGGVYVAKVASNITKVKVLSFIEGRSVRTPQYECLNLNTNRKVIFKSAAKFRSEVKVQAPKTIAEEPESDDPIVKLGAKLGHGGQHTRNTPMPKDSDTSETAVQIPTDAEISSPIALAAAVADAMHPRSGLAAKLDETMTPPPVREANWLDCVAGYTPTEEQRQILILADEMQRSTAEGRVMTIAAGAGTGKTSTLRMLETILVGLGQYTAFNAKLVNDSRSKFKKAMCNTTHSLAFKQVGKLYSHRIGGARVRSEQVAQMLGIRDMQLTVRDADTGDLKSKTLTAGFLASQVMQAVKKFCQSAERQVEPIHFKYIAGIDTNEPTNNREVVSYLMPYAQAAWKDLRDPNGKLPFNHDVYVKVWQLGEGSQKPYIPAAYILLDEAQDTAPVLLDILKQQTHALVILVGDDNQQIYDWRGAVNAMAAFPGAPRRLLSQSFRFGQTVADVANSILATLTQPTDLVMKGFLKIPSRVSKLPVEKPDCVLCRTNAMAVNTFLEAIAAGMKPFIVGGSSDTVDFCKAALELQAGRKTRHAELSCFESWTEVQAYVKTDEGEDLKLAVKLIDDFGAQKILDALEKMPEEKHADLTISTAHRSKGLEWKVVKLAQDFPAAGRMTDADRRLLYVAATRAQHVLDISECPPFSGGASRTGQPSRQIEIRYTIPMPTLEELAAYSQVETSAKAVTAAVGSNPQVFAAAKANDGWVPNPDKPRDTEFTWTKLGDKYVIRGPKEHENQTVTVRRRNGTTVTVKLGAALQRAADVWMYAV